MVQGTKYKLRFTAIDFDSGSPYNPVEIEVKAKRQSGAVTTLTKSGGDVFQLVDPTTAQPIVGRFGVDIDTTPEAGIYDVQVSIMTSTGLSVVKQRSFNVEPAQ